MAERFPFTQRPDRPVFPVILHTVHPDCEVCDELADDAMSQMEGELSDDGYADRRDDDFGDLLHGAIAHVPGVTCEHCPKDGE